MDDFAALVLLQQQRLTSQLTRLKDLATLQESKTGSNPLAGLNGKKRTRRSSNVSRSGPTKLEKRLLSQLDSSGALSSRLGVAEFVNLMSARVAKKAENRALFLVVLGMTERNDVLSKFCANGGVKSLKLWMKESLAAAEGGQRELLCMLLEALQRLPVTVGMLKNTKIGASVNKLCKNSAKNDPEIFRLASKVLNKWTAMASSEQAREEEAKRSAERREEAKRKAKAAKAANREAKAAAAATVGGNRADALGSTLGAQKRARSAKLKPDYIRPSSKKVKVMPRGGGSSPVSAPPSSTDPSAALAMDDPWSLDAGFDTTKRVSMGDETTVLPSIGAFAETSPKAGSSKGKRVSWGDGSGTTMERDAETGAYGGWGLVDVREFESDASERGSSTTAVAAAAGSGIQSGFGAARERDAAMERRMIEQQKIEAKRERERRIKEFEETLSWRKPRELAVPEACTEAREASVAGKSAEAESQAKRQHGVMAKIYIKASQIPNDPGAVPGYHVPYDDNKTPVFMADEETVDPVPAAASSGAAASSKATLTPDLSAAIQSLSSRLPPDVMKKLLSDPQLAVSMLEQLNAVKDGPPPATAAAAAAAPAAHTVVAASSPHGVQSQQRPQPPPAAQQRVFHPPGPQQQQMHPQGGFGAGYRPPPMAYYPNGANPRGAFPYGAPPQGPPGAGRYPPQQMRGPPPQGFVYGGGYSQQIPPQGYRQVQGYHQQQRGDYNRR